jgi:DNA repair protein RadD
MLKLRDYQEKAVNDLAKGLTKHRRVIGWLPTSSGKSVILAEISRRLLARDQNARILVLCHTSDILMQNHERCVQNGVASSGIYCAGLGKRESSVSVVHASRDSLGRDPMVCGPRSVVIVDECHLVSENEKTVYRKIIDTLAPRYVVGLTGTPWRLGNGRIFGPDKFWEYCAAHVDMNVLFKQGMLTPYILPSSEQIIDTSSVRVTAGDFNQKELEKASSSRETVSKCLDQWERLASDRNLTLIFCCSIEHAKLVHEMMGERRYFGAVLTEETDAKERAQILRDAKAGIYQYIANVAVLTTGVDVPRVDCLLFLRATQSLSLFVQMAGRALRLYPGKENALMIDCAGNFERLGTPENPKEPKEKRSRKKFTDEEYIAMGIDPALMKISGGGGTKECEKCRAVLPSAARSCYVCGEVIISHTDDITSAESLQQPLPGEHKVLRVEFEDRVSNSGRSMTVVSYFVEEFEKPVVEFIVHKVDNAYVQQKIDMKRKRLQYDVSKIQATKEGDFWRVTILA